MYLANVMIYNPENGDSLFEVVIILETPSDIPFEDDVTYTFFSEEQAKFLNKIGGKDYRNFGVLVRLKNYFDAPFYKFSQNKFKKI